MVEIGEGCEGFAGVEWVGMREGRRGATMRLRLMPMVMSIGWRGRGAKGMSRKSHAWVYLSGEEYRRKRCSRGDEALCIVLR